MTRDCMVCKKVIGEKCSQCGQEAKSIGTARKPGTKERVEIFSCAKCVRMFKKGEGGVTSGICEECKPQVMSGSQFGRKTCDV